MLFKRVSEMEKGIHWSDSDVQLYKSAYEMFPIHQNFEKNTKTFTAGCINLWPTLC
jgi:hypothetical protein